MPDEAKEVFPFQMMDKKPSKIDFRPKENFLPNDTEEDEADPKDSSAPGPVLSSSSPMTIEPSQDKTASVTKDSTSHRGNESGKPTSFGVA